MNNKIVKLQFGDYFKWNNLSREDKVKRNKQIAKLYLDKGPSILNYYNALKAYFGGFNPKNPYLLTGEPIILPGMNPTKGVLTAAKAVRTLEDYLKTTKVTAPALEGSSMARSAYATDRYIGGRMFLNTLPEEAMKILGHGMAKSPTILDALARLRYILDNGIKGKFYTAPLKVSKEAAMAGEAIGTGGATPYFDGHFLITGKPGQMINSVDDIGTIYINDAYENEEALKAAQKMKEYLTKTYPNKVFKLYSEGFKKGGSIKLANARKWKHKDGGIIKGLFGLGDSFWNFLYKTGIGSKGDFKRMKLDLVDFGILQDNSENPNQQIGGPTILPSITSGTVIEGLSPRAGKLANRAWLENSNPITNLETLLAAKDWVEMMKDKMRTITAKVYPTKRGRPIGSKNKPKPIQESIELKPIKLETDYTQSGTSLERAVEGKRYGIPRKGRVSSNDRNARAMESGDARTTNAGYTNVKKGQIKLVENNLDKYPEYERKALERELLKLYRKNKPESEINKVKREFYKYLARKYGYFKVGGIIKAGFGLKLSNTVNKIGDFFNSNTGKGLLNLGMQAFGAIKGSIDANNYSNSFDAETNSLLKAMDASQRKNNYKQASQIASEIIKLKQLENPDIHYGPIDKLLLENQIADSLYDDSEMIKYQMLRALEKLKLMEAIQGSSSGILDTVGGLLGNFIGNKKDTSTNTSSNNSTFGNYVSTLFKNPGTFNSDGSFNTSLGTYKWEDGKIKNISNTYGTFNADGSMNLGGLLGTISINGGYKPRKFGTLMNYT